MSDNENKLLLADEKILHHIFPDAQSTRTSILVQNFNTCTFVAHQCGPSGDDVVVRLEMLGEETTHFRTIAALQSMAKHAIPDLVPTVERCGNAITDDGRAVEFSVTKFVPNAVTLESVWDDMEDVQQLRIGQDLQGILKKLHSLKLSNNNVATSLQDTPFSDNSEATKKIIGGPNTGYFTDIQGFLRGLIEGHNPASKKQTSFLSTDALTGNVTIRSAYNDITPVLISLDDLRHLQDAVVLCHQDLEPRNILVRPIALDGGTAHYQIAAIIDWEMAGLFPFSYEYVYKDLFLGNSNLYPTWYALFKDFGAPLVPMSPLPRFHALFMEAIELIHQSADREAENVSVLFTKMWIEREGITRQGPAGTGWLKQGNRLRSKRIAPTENDELVQCALKVLGRI